MVVLLKMIRDITHSKKERKESAMMIAESDVELFVIFQGSGESLDDLRDSASLESLDWRQPTDPSNTDSYVAYNTCHR